MKVSEWIDKGAMASGMCLLSVEKESQKAYGIKAKKFNSYGNLYDSICWIPKSLTASAINDYYDHWNGTEVFVPTWIVDKKQLEGYVI